MAFPYPKKIFFRHITIIEEEMEGPGRPCCAPTVHINIMFNVIYNGIADLILVFNLSILLLKDLWVFTIYHLNNNMQCFSSRAIYFNFAIADSQVKDKYINGKFFLCSG